MKFTKRNFLTLISGIGWVVGLSSLLTGCAKPQAVTKEFISAQKVEELMNQLDLIVPNIFILDSEYGLPTKAWINEILYPELFAFQKREGVSEYAKESNDCEDQSMQARFVANKLNNQTSNRGIRGIAFGEFHYKRLRQKDYHSLNFAITKPTDKYEIIFFEPQTSEIVALTDKEIESTIGWII